MMSRNIKIIIAGGRDFKNFEAVKVEVDSILKSYLGDNIDFWDGQSKGTENMIQTAKNIGIEVKVVYY